MRCYYVRDDDKDDDKDNGDEDDDDDDERCTMRATAINPATTFKDFTSCPRDTVIFSFRHFRRNSIPKLLGAELLYADRWRDGSVPNSFVSRKEQSRLIYEPDDSNV